MRPWAGDVVKEAVEEREAMTVGLATERFSDEARRRGARDPSHVLSQMYLADGLTRAHNRR